MSIYASLWRMKFPSDGHFPFDDGDFVDVYAQMVPGHIDDVGTIWDWLPPPVADEEAWRAVFICGPNTTKATPRNGQEYVNPILVLTGEEYRASTWEGLWQRIADALPAHLQVGHAPVIARGGRRRTVLRTPRATP